MAAAQVNILIFLLFFKNILVARLSVGRCQTLVRARLAAGAEAHARGTRLRHPSPSTEGAGGHRPPLERRHVSPQRQDRRLGVPGNQGIRRRGKAQTRIKVLQNIFRISSHLFIYDVVQLTNYLIPSTVIRLFWILITKLE